LLRKDGYAWLGIGAVTMGRWRQALTANVIDSG
jgi:hypothetical protein